jgi:hypothetical protein
MGQVCIDPNADGLVAAYDMFPCNGTIEDKSGNGNTGTINGPVFEYTEIGGSMKFDGVDDYIEIADDPSMDITDDLTLSCWVKTTDSAGGIIAKFTGAGNQRSFAMIVSSGGRIEFWISSDGVTTEGESSNTIVNDGVAKHAVVVYTKSNNQVKFYIDNVLVSTGAFTSETNGIFNSTAAVQLGTSSLGGSLSGSIFPIEIFTRALSQSEITQLYNCGAQAVNFKTDYGVCESVAAESATPPGTELSNSPFRIESGSFKISTDTIGGDTCKVIECVTAGVCQVPAAYFFGGETQAAYGSWEWWVYNAGSSLTKFAIIGSSPSDISLSPFNGYEYRFNLDSSVLLRRLDSGSGANLFKSAAGSIATAAWAKLKITRSSDGEFSGYVNGTLLDVSGGSGTNPITDTTHTTSKYIVLDLDAGDKVAYAAPNGDCSIVKYQGVV